MFTLDIRVTWSRAAAALLAVTALAAVQPVTAANGGYRFADPAQGDRTGPCALLTTAEVQEVFAGTKPGALDRSKEKYGLSMCIWSHPTGQLSIIDGDDEDSVMEEARGWTMALVDPLKAQAERQVRYERLSGVGDEAIAIVERRDAAKGFLVDGAFLVVRRGKRQVSVLSTDLARRERADALKAFERLGKAMAARMNAS